MAEKVTVTLLRRISQYSVGDVVAFPAEIANDLIRRGIAEAAGTQAPVAPTYRVTKPGAASVTRA
jgi:hypothetical protein